MKIGILSHAWEDYLFWQQNDKAILNQNNQLIKEATRPPFEGAGKPEPLRENLSGFWSRRINLEHRLVYKTEGDSIFILQCRYHY